MLPLLAFLNYRALATDMLETLFGQVAQPLNCKPRLRAKLRQLTKLELLTGTKSPPPEQRGFSFSYSKRAHYDTQTLQVPFRRQQSADQATQAAEESSNMTPLT